MGPAPFRDATLIMNAESCGFVRRGSLLVPEIVISKPEGLADPCMCLQELVFLQGSWDQVLQVLQMQGR